MFDIDPDEDYLMASLQNFKPPESSVNKSISLFDKSEQLGGT